MSTEQPALSDALGGKVAPGDVIADKYRVDRLVGAGGMGVVVEAFHLSFDERVAIKFLMPHMGADQEAIERFEREARAAFKIKSEHVARVIDVGKLDRIPYMVMEYLEGQDLGDVLVDRKPMPIDRAVTYVLQAVDAVAEAHALNIVHRDLKPENLFLTTRADGSPCIKVLDFGLSKIQATDIKTSTRSRSITGTAQAMGTPEYMSPEQWMSARDVGPPTDQWALGVILYELITGQQPFHREHLAQLCTQILRGEPEPFESHRDDVPDELQAVIRRALAKEPEDRYPNLAALAIDLVPFAPQMKATVRRIKGIFERIGVATADLPLSQRGLGAMVLGSPPKDGPESAATPPSSPRASHPSAKLPAPDESTLVMPFPEAPERPPRPPENEVTQLIASPAGDQGYTELMPEQAPVFHPRPSLPPASGAFPPPSSPGAYPPASASGAFQTPPAFPPQPWEMSMSAPRDRRLPIVIAAAVVMCLLALAVVIVSVSGSDAPSPAEEAE